MHCSGHAPQLSTLQALVDISNINIAVYLSIKTNNYGRISKQSLVWLGRVHKLFTQMEFKLLVQQTRNKLFGHVHNFQHQSFSGRE